MNGNSITLPQRHCDKQAVEWLANKADSGKTNFERVLFEVNTYHAQYPCAKIRVDRLYTMSDKSHGLWVTVQRLLICYQWSLADCINPRRSAADADWENIMTYAKSLMPEREWQFADWREAKRYRAEYQRAHNWGDVGEFAAGEWRNERGDLLTRRGLIMGVRNYSLYAEVEGEIMELIFDNCVGDYDAQHKAGNIIFDTWKGRQ